MSELDLEVRILAMIGALTLAMMICSIGYVFGCLLRGHLDEDKDGYDFEREQRELEQRRKDYE